MKIGNTYKPMKGAKKLDLTFMREALKDGKCWACMGLVVKDEAGSHFELTGDDVLIEVELQPSAERVTARLGTVAGGANRGVWAIPAVGSEVALVIPDGDTSFMPIVVAVLSTGDISADLEEGNLLVVNGEGDIDVVPDGDLSLGIKDATEQAVRGNAFQTRFNNLVTEFNQLKTEFNLFVVAFNNHYHAGITPSTGTAITGVSSPSSLGIPSTAVGVPSTSSDLSPNVKVK